MSSETAHDARIIDPFDENVGGGVEMSKVGWCSASYSSCRLACIYYIGACDIGDRELIHSHVLH
jgi:hypothetical protein